MTSKATEGACAFAWRNYLLLHSGVSENDTRRSALYRYVTNLRAVTEYAATKLSMPFSETFPSPVGRLSEIAKPDLLLTLRSAKLRKNRRSPVP